MSLVRIDRKLSKEVSALSFAEPVCHVYNPLDYARGPHEAFLKRYGEGPKEVLLLGMNPGPWGMAQTGVPFGDVGLVRDWLGITGKVSRPDGEHPKRRVEGFDCGRSEVSGSRLWGWARERFETPERFLALWRGEIPSLMDGNITASPMPIPRSTEFVPEVDTLGDMSINTAEVCISLPSNTQPSTPSALGLAETADFETEEIQNYLAKKRLEKMLTSSNALQKIGSLTTDMPQVRREAPTTPPQ